MHDTLSLPTPIRTDGTTEFFDAVRAGHLLLQFCGDCEQFSLTGYWYCPHCLGATEWRECAGTGHVRSYSMVRSSSHPGFKTLLPYLIVEVQLSEGPILALRASSDPGSIKIGDRASISLANDGADEATPTWIIEPDH